MIQWIREIEFEDLLEKDAELIHAHCGLEVLCNLWQNLPGITLYLSEKSLFEIKKRYIRKHHDGTNVKKLAALLQVSEKFVYEALAETDKKDDRQGKLI